MCSMTSDKPTPDTTLESFIVQHYVKAGMRTNWRVLSVLTNMRLLLKREPLTSDLGIDNLHGMLKLMGETLLRSPAQLDQVQSAFKQLRRRVTNGTEPLAGQGRPAKGQ